MASTPVHILVIRLSAMGDVAMTMPVLRRLLIKYPQIELTVLTRPFFLDIFSDLPRTNVVIAYTDKQHKGIFGMLRLAIELKKLQFDLAANLHNIFRVNLLCLFLSFLGVKVQKVNKGRQDRRKLIRSVNKNFKQIKTMHQRYADVFSLMDFPVDLKQRIEVKKNSKPEELFTDYNKKIIGIAPYAAHKSKQYPISSMKLVIERLSKNDKVQLFLFGGGKAELDGLKEIAEEYENINVVAGKLSFKKELELISNLDLMISMDSGNGHLAAMFNVPVITIWGGTHPYAGFAPFQQAEGNQFLPDLSKFNYLPNSIFGKEPLEEYDEIMNSIKPTQILERAEKLLDI